MHINIHQYTKWIKTRKGKHVACFWHVWHVHISTTFLCNTYNQTRGVKNIKYISWLFYKGDNPIYFVRRHEQVAFSRKSLSKYTVIWSIFHFSSEFLSRACDWLGIEIWIKNLSFDWLQEILGKMEEKSDKVDIWINLFENKLPLNVRNNVF